MNEDWVAVVQAKLVTTKRYLSELEERLPRDEGSYLADRDCQLAVERLCQLIVECAIDTNVLLLDGLGQLPPQSARAGFESLEQPGVLDSTIARLFYTTFVGFRHRLVHDYERLDNRIVYRTAQMLLNATRQYIGAISVFLAQREADAK
ncbi:DUF86 domain-containing protein [Candidatus Poribacteria bacterium]|nr:DUF86 domain-containing protein [Candidatus Poribacteria bacterium]